MPPTISLLIGSLFLILTVISARSAVRLVIRGVRAVACVVSVERDTPDGWRATYQFRDREGRKRYGSFEPIYLRYPDHLVGTQIHVIYDPEMPSNVLRYRPRWFLYVGLIASLLVGLSISFAFFIAAYRGIVDG